ncbi:hypothetical protein SARC_10446 [Sphaeroforma arctica JP610]|uniref:Uncharacterized protein n=1 Tax=Sphaeroforma arctica JP610 TaxID=667725 RepID=A0A0L0FK18_9EUKA|nr:hypothetical protein SARC_10446 [Sphaeroforma arctica JP610]KNC77085.1 hypothetical protein SARC_10446 [Sphaeroforma arctica JP610]|eukprot:XP_014150987.1 hypothetical protein SARC_10446 [Sphaeroforma arctica JP610]
MSSHIRYAKYCRRIGEEDGHPRTGGPKALKSESESAGHTVHLAIGATHQTRALDYKQPKTTEDALRSQAPALHPLVSSSEAERTACASLAEHTTKTLNPTT